ncbi:unnamed protein product [Owenia fusiformis]|uniref:Pentatricopeptide repeat-containing protein n=1 Tax=Owenia fusiformis TaxID=6347 RepID=A0A8S4PTZ3_OWEFU|nr:unnamed protein product [Owenia fusiformis]
MLESSLLPVNMTCRNIFRQNVNIINRYWTTKNCIRTNQLKNNVFHLGLPAVSTSFVRHLYSHEVLGVEAFKKQKAILQDKMGYMKDKFIDRLRENVEDGNATIFSEDIKSILHLADTEAEFELAWRAIKRYNDQMLASSLPLPTFRFGPVVMRMLYTAGYSDWALELATDPQYKMFVNQLSTYTVLLDLLYEQARYLDALEVYFAMIKDPVAGVRNPYDATLIALACCYKMNSKEAYDNLLSILEIAREREINILSRGLQFAAALALEQGHTNVAFEILAGSNSRPSQATVNMRAMIYFKLGRIDDALAIMQVPLQQDMPEQYRHRHQIFPKTIKCARETIEATGDQELQKKFKILEDSLLSQGQVSMMDLDSYLNSPIVRRSKSRDNYNSRTRSGYKDPSKDYSSFEL